MNGILIDGESIITIIIKSIGVIFGFEDGIIEIGGDGWEGFGGEIVRI